MLAVTRPVRAALAGGMASGDRSAAFVFGLPDGRALFAETSLRLLLTAGGCT